MKYSIDNILRGVLLCCVLCLLIIDYKTKTGNFDCKFTFQAFKQYFSLLIKEQLIGTKLEEVGIPLQLAQY